MISHIKGTLDQILDGAVVLECGGIGYLLQVSNATIGRLPRSGAEIKLFAYMQVKEDGISLYGFLTQEEKDIFNLLITVSGVGPKAAMGVVGAMTPSQIMIAIITDDVVTLSKAPGVGKKTALRIAMELKDKIKTRDAIAETISSPQQSISLASAEKQDAIDALITLGYNRSEAMKAVLETAVEGMSAEQIIKQSLRRLSTNL